MTEKVPALSNHISGPSESFRERNVYPEVTHRLSPAGFSQSELMLMRSAVRPLNPQPQAQVTSEDEWVQPDPTGLPVMQ